jgi:putative toxin-antitoxin system antitoxin component (TIGR02293 family)
MEEHATAVVIKELVEVLGGKSVFKKPLKSEDALISIVRQGLPYQSYASLLETIEAKTEFAQLFLGITKRTLQRRQQKERLETLESDRVLRLAQVLVKSIDIFKDKPSAIEWLHAENINLGGQSPLDCLDTEIGEHRVMDLLGRIEYGIHS